VRIRRSSPLFLGFFLSILFFANLGNYGFLEDNEARFLEISWEMAESHDFLIPKLDFITHFHKPPATFWVVSAFLTALGMGEFAARLPVVLAALATLLLTAKVPEQKPTKLFTALVLACNTEFWLLSRTVLTDMFLTLTVTLCMVSAWTLSKEQNRVTALIFWASLGASTLVKGPVGPAIVGLALLTFQVATRLLRWRRFEPMLGIPLFLAITLPWYLLACQRYPQLFGYLAGYQTVERFSTQVHGRGGPLWFFIPVILLGFLPWSAILLQSARRAFRERTPLDLFLLSWLLAPLTLFSLSGSKLPTYILPLFPAMALLVSGYWESEELSKRSATILNLFVTTLGMIAFLFSLAELPPEIVPAQAVITASGIVLIVSGLLGFRLIRGRHFKASAVGVALGFGCFLITLSSGFGKTDRAYSARYVSSIIKPHLRADTIVAEYSDQLCGLPFYLRRRIVQVAFARETLFEVDGSYEPYLVSDLHQFHQLYGDRHALLIVRPSDYDREKLADWTIIQRGRWLVLEKEAT
jgi:4-amino-4-deoxy-L-arabinose transferase-like glycosyltransferase